MPTKILLNHFVAQVEIILILRKIAFQVLSLKFSIINQTTSELCKKNLSQVILYSIFF